MQETEPQPSSTWVGYKFVGNNIDKNTKPRYQRHENRGKSLHYFHGYAVRDRLDLSALSNLCPPPCSPALPVFLPSESDLHLLKGDFKTLISRYTTKHIVVGLNIISCFTELSLSIWMNIKIRQMMCSISVISLASMQPR